MIITNPKDIELFNRGFHRNDSFFDFDSLDLPEVERLAYRNRLESFINDTFLLIRDLSNPIELKFGIGKNLLLGAHTNIVDGQYFININRGNFFVLYNLFSWMLCSPRLLPTIGNAKDEEPVKLEEPYIIEAQRLDDLIHNEPNLNVIPKDERRRRLPHIMFSFAMKFLVRHEVGHLINGHIPYLKSIKPNTSTRFHDKSGFSFMCQTREEGMIRQGLELDADRVATYFCLGELLMLEVERKNQNDNSLISSEDELAEVFVSTIIILFRLLMPYEDAASPNKYYRSHPLTAARMGAIINDINEMIESGLMPKHSLFQKINYPFMTECMINIEETFHEMSLFAGNVPFAVEAFTQLFQDKQYLVDLHKAHIEVRQSLNEFRLR